MIAACSPANPPSPPLRRPGPQLLPGLCRRTPGALDYLFAKRRGRSGARKLAISEQKTTSILCRVEKIKSLTTNGLRDFYSSFVSGRIALLRPAAAIVAATQAYAKINAEGRWTDPPDRLNLADLMERMTPEEMMTYARDTVPPDRFMKEIAGTEFEEETKENAPEKPKKVC
jgi:hypothetical protein